MEQQNISINDLTESDYSEWGLFVWKQADAERIFVWILSVIEIPVMILTLIALCFLVKSRPAASVFISHLILSDLIQVGCLLAKTISYALRRVIVHHYSLVVGLYFMACVSFERYLLVSHPIWYKSHQSLKLSCFLSVIVWFVPLTSAVINPPDLYFSPLRLCIACLIPYPIVILCFVGTCRGLSRSISLTAVKRKLILGSLFLVLLTYTFLILPFVIINILDFHFSFMNTLFYKFYYYTRMLLFVNPLADCMLYLFMRPDAGDLMKCCRHQRWKHSQDEHSVVNPQSSCSTVVCCISAQKPESHSLNTCSSV
ncbi:mas-related G-protein coupled receptor member A5-like [Puntigrus tetrazona]|uniref:mas-related G-protein coupled receptor member A5-like n=1 Tax=Puntigrus tetrazona TaxID=1606681 RepID=UPI001C8A91F8|nr:mas-related G-protein coupled receptor member A5-like [Puntigrus tetrazona]